MLRTPRLKDKVAIVTGGGAGIGRSICLALASEGVRVVVADIDEKAAQETCKLLSSITDKFLAIKTDVSKEADVMRMVEVAVGGFGRVDILCANAGIHAMNWVVDTPEEEWDKIMDVNAKGVFLCCKHAARQMIKQGHGGKIINTASQSGKTGYGLEAHYSASKFAVVCFTMALANELGRYNINVNAVCPGVVDTALQRRLVEREAEIRGTTPEIVRQRLIEATPLGRIEKPEDVAKLVVKR